MTKLIPMIESYPVTLGSGAKENSKKFILWEVVHPSAVSFNFDKSGKSLRLKMLIGVRRFWNCMIGEKDNYDSPFSWQSQNYLS